MWQSKNKIIKSSLSKYQGYILFIVLIFLLIFSFTGLHSLMYTTQMIKITHHRIKKENNMHIAQQILKRLELYSMKESFLCEIYPMPAFELADMSISWWIHHGCHGQFNSMQYYYTIEPLGVDSCGIIKKNKYNDYSIAEYTRLTLYMLTDQSAIGRIILQSTIVKSTQGNSSCHHPFHVIHLGRQMLREI